MGKDIFKILQVKRKCQFDPEINCGFSFEHTKNLAINGCVFAAEPTEYFSPVCQNCINIAAKFAATTMQVMRNQQFPTLDPTEGNADGAVI